MTLFLGISQVLKCWIVVSNHDMPRLAERLKDMQVPVPFGVWLGWTFGLFGFWWCAGFFCRQGAFLEKELAKTQRCDGISKHCAQTGNRSWTCKSQITICKPVVHFVQKLLVKK